MVMRNKEDKGTGFEIADPPNSPQEAHRRPCRAESLCSAKRPTGPRSHP